MMVLVFAISKSNNQLEGHFRHGNKVSTKSIKTLHVITVQNGRPVKKLYLNAENLK